MHSIHDISKRETLVRQEFLEFVGGITVNPVPGRTAICMSICLMFPKIRR